MIAFVLFLSVGDEGLALLNGVLLYKIDNYYQLSVSKKSSPIIFKKWLKGIFLVVANRFKSFPCLFPVLGQFLL